MGLCKEKKQCLYGHFWGDLFSPIPLSCENYENKSLSKINWFTVYKPRCEKTGLRGFGPGPTQTGLYSHRRWLEA